MILIGVIFNVVYLGAYDEEIAAAQAYDLAALKYWGTQTLINFKVKFQTHLNPKKCQVMTSITWHGERALEGMVTWRDPSIYEPLGFD